MNSYKLTLKISVLFIAIMIFFIPGEYTKASTLSCWDIDGASIFGYDTWDDVYIFIGAIANEFDSDSIANEFGAGNEFSSDSIFNEFGDFGSEFSSESAFNEFANKPPILIDDDNNFIGYLTVNEFKTPAINPYYALNCAKESFASANSKHEDMKFSDIPRSNRSFSSGYSQSDIENLLKKSCPKNASYVNGRCSCDNGYVANASGNACITITQFCQDAYGINSYGSGTSCYCMQGYEWNDIQTSCIKKIIPKISKVEEIIKQEVKCGSRFIKNSDNKCIPATKPTTDNTKIKKEFVKNCPIGTTPSLDKTYCVKFPKNAHIVNSKTDVWLCNEGYTEINNNCVKKEKEEDINIGSVNFEKNQKQQNYLSDATSKDATKQQNILIILLSKIKEWFINLFK